MASLRRPPRRPWPGPGMLGVRRQDFERPWGSGVHFPGDLEPGWWRPQPTREVRITRASPLIVPGKRPRAWTRDFSEQLVRYWQALKGSENSGFWGMAGVGGRPFVRQMLVARWVVVPERRRRPSSGATCARQVPEGEERRELIRRRRRARKSERVACLAPSCMRASRPHALPVWPERQMLCPGRNFSAKFVCLSGRGRA